MKRQIDIPLVQQDLSHEETILQISLSLEKLDKVVSALFSNINGNIDRQKRQLASVHERCASARSKVEKLTGIEKSIRVFASSKFPGPTPPTFYPLEELKIEETKRNIRIPFTPLPPDKLSIHEKLKFYHIKDSTLQLRKNESITPSEGLGEVPQGIKTVNSLLLYNTKHNLYSQYKILDPLTPAHKHIIVEEENTRPQIGPAPHSLSAYVDNQPSLQNYFYSPSLQDVPDINAPLNLPNLTGIAGDLRFVEIEDQIDFTKKDKSTEQPAFQDIVEAPAPVEEVTIISKSAEILKKVDPPAVAAPPPPPPPPPPLPPPELDGVAPPPTPKPRSEAAKGQASKPSLPPATDSRADLMAAIRLAGGTGKAKLKPIGQEDSVLTGSSKPPGKPGNFMEDLHAKLSMRRKGISGKIDTSEGGGIGMLDRINSMIPPPPPKDSDSPADGGSDWEE